MTEPSPDIVEQAIGWRVRLASGMAPVEEHDACARWRALHPSHEQAWQRLAIFDGRLGGLAVGRVSQALRHAPGHPERRRVLKGLVLLAGSAALLGAGTAGLRGSPWLAQERTGTGERRRLALPDGGWLQMNSGTALDLEFDGTQRRIRLLAGDIFVQTGREGSQRPFWVDTALGRLQALGTRFAVELGQDSALLAVEQGRVAVFPAAVDTSAVIEAGQQVRFDRQRLFGVAPLDRDALAWQDGFLVVRQWRLEQLCTALARYRPGVLRCDPAVADLLISGVFPTDDPDRALAALARSLPVRVHYRTRWWATLEAA